MNMNTLPPHRLLNTKEAAEFLGVKEMTLSVWKSTNRYKIPCVKVGRLVKYRHEDLLEFVERRMVNKPLEPKVFEYKPLKRKPFRHQRSRRQR